MKSKAKCPNCKSDNLFLIELWKDAAITWEQIDGIFERSEGSLEPGEAYKVEGKCKDCSHRWTFRKVLQIDDLAN